MIIGVISDTHGLLRPEALGALRDSEHIIHAGDIGDPEILKKLTEIAPVTAVRGNVDREPWARKIHLTEVLYSKQRISPSRCCTFCKILISSPTRRDFWWLFRATATRPPKKTKTACSISIPEAQVHGASSFLSLWASFSSITAKSVERLSN
jgi:hypothetical protein